LKARPFVTLAATFFTTDALDLVGHRMPALLDGRSLFCLMIAT
jgi:hypothetical protein